MFIYRGKPYRRTEPIGCTIRTIAHGSTESVPTETISTDANGNWTRLVGPLTAADIGLWTIGVNVGFTLRSRDLAIQ